ncbi:MAG TPA: hypothetical protein VNJ01_07320 [Bacteriovoracaceae bacterium]|nr:hypothetical protein [Bacteriovoracaceae bacterium]
MKNLLLFLITALLIAVPKPALSTNDTSADVQEQEEARSDGRATSSVNADEQRSGDEGMLENQNFKNSRQTPIKKGEIIDNTGHDTNTRFIP